MLDTFNTPKSPSPLKRRGSCGDGSRKECENRKDGGEGEDVNVKWEKERWKEGMKKKGREGGRGGEGEEKEWRRRKEGKGIKEEGMEEKEGRE